MIHRNDQDPHLEPLRWPGPVIRLTLLWDGSDWRIKSEQRVDSMTLPAPDPLPGGENSRGFWIETVDRDGRVRHREVMPDPLAGMEQFEEGGLVTRLTHPPHEVLIEVLIPDLPELAEVHLISNPATLQSGHEHEPRPRRSKVSISGRPPQDDRDDSTEDGEGHPPARDHHTPRRPS